MYQSILFGHLLTYHDKIFILIEIYQNGSILQIGYFSTRQETITIDQISESLPKIDEKELFSDKLRLKTFREHYCYCSWQL